LLLKIKFQFININEHYWLGIKLKKKKKLLLVVGHSSWWKKNKHRNESTRILKKYKREGWKLEKVSCIPKNKGSVETRDFKEYSLFKDS
tara:strand:- start:170 stop:436 length:267 start_codon:yes stop_codon:yes gene_type:complete